MEKLIEVLQQQIAFEDCRYEEQQLRYEEQKLEQQRRHEEQIACQERWLRRVTTNSEKFNS